MTASPSPSALFEALKMTSAWAGHYTGNMPTEPVPIAFCPDTEDKFLFAAGTASGQLASYRIDSERGTLAPLTVQSVGQRPAAIALVSLGN